MAYIEKSNSYIAEKNINKTEANNRYKYNGTDIIFNKTFNIFNKTPKKKIKQLNSQTRFYKARYHSKDNMKSIYPPSRVNLDPRDKDGLFLELVRAQKDMKIFNKELKSIKNDIKYLEEGNLTNFLIIGKVIELQENKENNNNDEYELKYKSRNNNIEKYYKYEENKKINVLKKQIILSDNIIQDNELKIEELKNKSKQKKYQELYNKFMEKEKEINDLNQKSNELNFILLENAIKMRNFYIKSMQNDNEVKSIKKKIKYEKHLYNQNQEQIKIFNDKIKGLNNEKNKLEEKIKKIEQEQKEFDKEENNLNKEIEENNELIKEKDNNKYLLQNLRNTEERATNDVIKIDKKISLQKKDNINYIYEVEEYEKIRPALVEKSKIPGHNQEIMRNMEREIEKIIKEMKKRNEEDENKEKNMNNEIINNTDMNNNYIDEIYNYEKEKMDIDNELNKLKIDFKNSKNKNETLNKNFEELIEKYIKHKEEYEKSQKEYIEKKKKQKLENDKIEKQMNKDKELKEKNFIQEKEKYDKEISELKAKNNLLKKEKEKLQKSYDDKMKAIKKANESRAKLKNILDEITRISSS